MFKPNDLIQSNRTGVYAIVIDWPVCWDIELQEEFDAPHGNAGLVAHNYRCKHLWNETYHLRTCVHCGEQELCSR